MDNTITLSKHEMVIDRDYHDSLIQQLEELKRKTISVYSFGRDSSVIDALIDYGQEERMTPMEEVIAHLKENNPEELKEFMEEVDTKCAECLLMQAW